MKRNNHTCTKSPNRTTTNLLKMLRNGVFSHWNQHVTKMVRCMMHAKRDHENPMVKTTIHCQGLNLHKNSLPSFGTSPMEEGKMSWNCERRWKEQWRRWFLWVKVEATNWILILSLSKFWPSQGKWGESGVMVECSREQKMWLERFFLLHGWPPSIGGRGLCHDGLWGLHCVTFHNVILHGKFFFAKKINFELVLGIKSNQLKIS